MARSGKTAKYLAQARRVIGFYLRHLFLWCLLLFVGYWIWLDFTVAELFANRRWSLPTRVYASPLELYPGLSVSNGLIEATLKQLDYREDSEIGDPGSYARVDDGIVIFTRGHKFPDSPSAAGKLKIVVSDGRIIELLDVDSRNSISNTRLEPLEIGSVHATKFEDRVIVATHEIPDFFIRALVAIEDRRFFDHFGIDPVGIARAIFQNILSGGVKQGASTITQQLVKNQFLSNERSYARKIREALMAISLERRYSKSVLLNAYINEIFLGQDGNRAVHGFGLGARFIFGKRLQDLTISESALLIGMVKAPSSYDPRRNPQAALARRNTVLKVLLDRGVIDNREYGSTVNAALELSDRQSSELQHFAAFIDLVRVQLTRDYRDAHLQQAGLNIYTTLDPFLHAAARSVITQRLDGIEVSRQIQRGSLETASIIVDPRTSEVKSLIGGRAAQRGNFNRALRARRTIGSLVKPFVYLTALEQSSRFNVMSPLSDTPISVTTENGEIWTPKNYGNKSHGEVALRSAFANSYNLATVRLGLDVGLDNVVRRLRSFGIERKFDNVPALLLGALSLTPVEVAQLYQGIANDGFRVPLRAIRSVTNDKKAVLQRYSPSVEQVITPASAVVTQYLLSQVVANGTARSAGAELKSKLPLAGKTGTSNDERDSWFAGFSRNLLTVIWIGHDDNTETGLTGASGALRIWTDLMKEFNVLPIEFSKPGGLQWRWVSSSGDAIVSEHCEGAMYVPLALPHGLSSVEGCEAFRETPARENIWNRLQGLFR